MDTKGDAPLSLTDKRFQRFTQLGWGAMDMLIVLVYVVDSLRRGDIPFWTDLHSILALASEHAELAYAIGFASLAVYLTVFISGCLFLKGARMAAYLGLAQAPFRVILVPSIPVALFWPDPLIETAGWLVFFLSLVAEVVKVWSLLLLLRSQSNEVADAPAAA